MTPAQWNEYERQAQVIERNQKWKEQQKQLITEIMNEDAKDGLYEHIGETNKMLEISDEDIKRKIKREYLYLNYNEKRLMIEGAKWYKEQLKKI